MSEAAPRVFVSSTVRDLADLRSAVKFWLEDFGFDVLTSETPSFPHPLDRDAIAASLAPIADCDFYVLLVGTRVGTLIADEGISVTRAEFRRARELRRATGKPMMLHLVRAEVDAARRLGKPARGLSDEDWAAIVDFLAEIETEEVKGDPNWVHPFSSFRDVVDVLRATLRVNGPLTAKGDRGEPQMGDRREHPGTLVSDREGNRGQGEQVARRQGAAAGRQGGRGLG
jgi:Domain of unknown function (DUF4062)